MLQLITTLQTWYAARFSDERGATAVEYGLMVSLIAVAIVGAVFALGGSLSDMFTSVETEITSVP